MAKKQIRIKGVDVADGGIDLDAEDVRLADGTRLTEAGARELAEQVLRTSGRPSLTAHRAGAAARRTQGTCRCRRPYRV